MTISARIHCRSGSDALDQARVVLAEPATINLGGPEEREKALVSYGSDLQAGVRSLIDEANQLRATAVRKHDVRAALKGIDTALKALELFAKLSGQLQGPQHNHLHLHAEVPSREEERSLSLGCAYAGGNN
jgi:hypothetical protein